LVGCGKDWIILQNNKITMEELLCQVLGNPETVNKIITELGPKALDNAEHIVISGIETSGQVVECLIKDGKIVEHSAKTVQEAVKSAENVAISIVETGGKICEYLIKDGKIVQHTAETVQLGIKTTGDIAKELIDRGTDTINTAIETTGNVVANSISERYAYKTAKEAEKTERNRDNNLTKQEAIRKTGDVLGMKILVDGKVKTIEWDSLVEMCRVAMETGNPEIAANMLAMKYQSNVEQAKSQSEDTREKWVMLESMFKKAAALGVSIITFSPVPYIINETGSIGDKIAKRIPFLKNKDDKKKEEIEEKEKALEFMQMAYDLNSKLNTEFPASQFPMLNPIKRLLDASVKQKNPELIAMTIQVIQEEISDMQNMAWLDVERIR
jgi:hypothetical protein